MQKCERETNILINQADLADGFFVFGTSERSHYQRALKRCAGGIVSDKQLGTDECPYWQLKIDAKCLSKTNFSLRAYTRLSASKKTLPDALKKHQFPSKKRKSAA